MLEGLQMDVEYVQRRSLSLDIAIIAKTIPVVLRGSR
jgi:lipopolysaccharide/colanic/teichoic acid biosynthesis glycosyltransferase